MDIFEILEVVMSKENKVGLFDRAKRKALNLLVTGLSFTPMAVNAATPTPKDDVKTDRMEMVEYRQNKEFIHVNEGDSVLTAIQSQTFQLSSKDKILEYQQDMITKTDKLNNGYTMVKETYQYDKNGALKENNDKLTLSTPDGREVDCSFLNKFDFTFAHECTNEVTGKKTVITHDYAKSVNDKTEKKAHIELIKRVKNPEDRDAIKQYVHRSRMDLENMMTKSHDIYIRNFRTIWSLINIFIFKKLY